MKTVRVVLMSAMTAVAVMVSGCSMESSTAPRAPQLAPQAPQMSKGIKLDKPVKMEPLQREKSLPSHLSATKVIGVLGGLLSIPEAGVTIIVPPGAVLTNTTFSVTPHPGSHVEYDFEPHGTQFAVPLLILQDLRGMRNDKGQLSTLQMGYFPDPNAPTTVSELMDVNVDLFHTVAVSTIWHFSGYMMATGRSASFDY